MRTVIQRWSGVGFVGRFAITVPTGLTWAVRSLQGWSSPADAGTAGFGPIDFGLDHHVGPTQESTSRYERADHIRL